MCKCVRWGGGTRLVTAAKSLNMVVKTFFFFDMTEDFWKKKFHFLEWKELDEDIDNNYNTSNESTISSYNNNSTVSSSSSREVIKVKAADQSF